MVPEKNLLIIKPKPSIYPDFALFLGNLCETLGKRGTAGSLIYLIRPYLIRPWLIHHLRLQLHNTFADDSIDGSDQGGQFL